MAVTMRELLAEFIVVVAIARPGAIVITLRNMKSVNYLPGGGCY